MGVVCTSPGSGGVDRGSTGSGGGVWGSVAMKAPSGFAVGGVRCIRRLGKPRIFGQVPNHGLALFVRSIRRNVRLQLPVGLFLCGRLLRQRRNAWPIRRWLFVSRLIGGSWQGRRRTTSTAACGRRVKTWHCQSPPSKSGMSALARCPAAATQNNTMREKTSQAPSLEGASDAKSRFMMCLPFLPCNQP